ncbi:MAG: hypothetical protein RJA07_2453 [Bacteroidota bacterium]|jgi:hypothetical protein
MKKIICTILFIFTGMSVFSQSSLMNVVCDSINSKRAYCSSFTNLNNHNAEVFGPGVNAGGGYTADDLLQTDLSLLQPNAIIDSAFLELSPDSNWNNINPGGTEDNSVTISLITSIWNQNTVNYTSEPTCSSNNQIIIPASTLPFHYNKFDVTSWVQYWVNQPLLNYGLKLSPINTSGASQRRYCWASSTNPKVSIRPKYKIYYRLPTGLNYQSSQSSIAVFIAKNDEIKIEGIAANEIVKSIIITKIDGTICYYRTDKILLPIFINNLPNNTYIISVETNLGKVCRKFLVEK